LTRKSIDVIEAQVPAELDVHLIPDNCGTHKTALIGNGSPNVLGPGSMNFDFSLFRTFRFTERVEPVSR